MPAGTTQLDLGQEIISATQEVFSTMLMMEVVGEDISGRSKGTIESNISSMIGLGGGVRGMLAIHCPAEVAIAITAGFLGMEVSEIDDDVKDAIGEIANMLAGNLKIAFANSDISMELAIPTTVVGQQFRLSGIAGAARHSVSLTFEQGTFWVELMYVVN